jgi:hypothetical protein
MKGLLYPAFCCVAENFEKADEATPGTHEDLQLLHDSMNNLFELSEIICPNQ